MNLKCDKCEYVWDCSVTEKVYVTCPSCLRKIKREEVAV